MFTIRKLFKFEMAHVLDSSYSEECQILHGHSYRLEIMLQVGDLNSDGMVIDFKKLKEIINREVISKFDHACVISRSNRLLSLLIDRPGIVVVAYNPTAEMMVKDMYNLIFHHIKREIPYLISVTIRLHETDTGYAEYTEGR